MEWFGTMLSQFGAWFWGLIQPLIEPLTKVVKAFIATGTFLFAFVAVIVETMDVGAAFSNLADTMNTATGMLAQLPVTDVVGQLNRIFPLNELLVFSAVLFGAQVLIIGLKVIFWLIDLLYKVISVVWMILSKIL